jgi:hypothetical protein
MHTEMITSYCTIFCRDTYFATHKLGMTTTETRRRKFAKVIRNLALYNSSTLKQSKLHYGSNSAALRQTTFQQVIK